jgi:hypothetical protein
LSGLGELGGELYSVWQRSSPSLSFIGEEAKIIGLELGTEEERSIWSSLSLVSKEVVGNQEKLGARRLVCLMLLDDSLEKEDGLKDGIAGIAGVLRDMGCPTGN